ncbi:hypothetical protein WN943_024214 [Citrus x changshan-huyou]
MQIMSSPVMLLSNARDSYINSFNGGAVPEVIEAATMGKSYSVGAGKIRRIDEDKPCTFEENLLYPRSKSHAVGNILRRY